MKKSSRRSIPQTNATVRTGNSGRLRNAPGMVGRAARILREKRDEYVKYPTLEMGKVTRFGYFEVDLVADILDYYAENGERLLAEQSLPGEPGATLVTEPVGVILAIEPWNFPYYQLARVIAPQLIAGNVVMMKHAESTPQCALAIARLFEEAGVPEGAYTNLFCSIEQIADLIDDFRVRGVTLTGSERAGASVGERAGRNLKKAVLELGGSDPALILEGAPLEHAVEQCVMGRTYNSGQGCVNIKRVIVVGKERGAQMLAALKERFEAITVGDPTDEATLIGPLASERALDGLLQQIEDAKAAGARIVHGGKRVDGPGFYLEPTSSRTSPRTTHSTSRRHSARCSPSTSWTARKRRSSWPMPPVRPGRLRLRRGYRARQAGRLPHRVRHGVHQHLLHRLAAAAFRRRQELRFRARTVGTRHRRIPQPQAHSDRGRCLRSISTPSL